MGPFGKCGQQPIYITRSIISGTVEGPKSYLGGTIIMHTVWTSNVVPTEKVRRPPGDSCGGSPDFMAKITGNYSRMYQIQADC